MFEDNDASDPVMSSETFGIWHTCTFSRTHALSVRITTWASHLLWDFARVQFNPQSGIFWGTEGFQRRPLNRAVYRTVIAK
jgi:hypothetical protein